MIAIPHTEANKEVFLDIAGVPVPLQHLDVSIDDNKVVIGVNRDAESSRA